MNKLGFIKSFLLNFIKLNNNKVAVLKGSDMLGNKYYEIPTALGDAGGDNRPKRYVDGESSMTTTNVTIPNIPQQWEAWLRFRRDEVPTPEELQLQMIKKNTDRLPIEDSNLKIYPNVNRSLEDQILPDMEFKNPAVPSVLNEETLTNVTKHVAQVPVKEPELKMEKQDQDFKNPPMKFLTNEISIQAKLENSVPVEETKPKIEKKTPSITNVKSEFPIQAKWENPVLVNETKVSFVGKSVLWIKDKIQPKIAKQDPDCKAPPIKKVKNEVPIYSKRQDPVRVEVVKTKIETPNLNPKKPVITYVSNEFPIRAKREDPVRVEEAKPKLSQYDQLKEQATKDLDSKKTRYTYVSNEFPIRPKRDLAQEMKIKQK